MPPSTPLKTGAWDQEEDELLYYWQSKVGNKWSEVAKHIPGRTGQQCAQRWRHKVNPNIRRDKWAEEEDTHLMDLVKTFGIGKWAEIARHMEGRTDQQCMGRWRRHLDPNIRRDSWSPEEDQRLRALHQQYGTSWSRISKALKGRTSQQCRARWHQLDSGRSRRGGTGGGGGGPGTGGRRAAAGKRRSGSRRRFDSSGSDEDDEVDDALTESEPEADVDAEAEAEAGAVLNDGAVEEVAVVVPARASIKPEPDAPSPPPPPPQRPQPPPLDQAVSSPGQRQPLKRRGSDDAGGVGGSSHVREQAAAAPRAKGERDQDQHMAGGVSDSAPGDQEAEPPGHIGRAADSVLASARRRLAARKQQQQCGPAPAFAPLSPPRRPPRPSCGGAGAAAVTPRRRGVGPDSPGAGVMSPSLLSPTGAARRLSVGGCYEGDEPGSADGPPAWQRLVQARGLDDEEAAGAETLLHMATVFRRGSGDLEPPGASLRRSDFITGNTPTKRSPGRRPQTRLLDDLSPSPFKKARSFTGAGAGAELLEGAPDFRRRLAAAAGAADDEHDPPLAAGAGAAPSGGQAPGSGAGTGPRSARRLTAKRSAWRRAGALPFRAPDEEGPDDPMGEAAAASDSDQDGLGEDGGDGRAAHAIPIGFDLDAAADFIGGAGEHCAPSPGPHMRPPGTGPAAGPGPGLALVLALASPPAAGRRGRWGVDEASTPGKAAMNLLASPTFDRLATGCATPTHGNAQSQPSPATLALLQSPQPSAMLEPFWTPYSGLTKEPLLRNTSETPDPASSGRRKAARGLFSPQLASKQPVPGERAAAPAAAAEGAAAAAQESQVGEDPLGTASSRRAGAGADGGEGAAASSHHRVVRRLDRHEAWGAAAASAAGGAHGGACPGSPKPTPACQMLSPPKRARVPLFCEDAPPSGGAGGDGSSGAPPGRPVGVRLEFDGLGGGAAAGRGGGGGGRSYEPSRLNPASVARAAAGAAAARAATPSVRSPRRPASWKLPPASALLMSPPRGSQEKRRLPVPQAVMEAAALVAAAAAQQQQSLQQQPMKQMQQQDHHQQQQAPQQQDQQPQQSDGAQQLPGTPVQSRMLDGQQSTSATPTTPSVRPAGNGGPGGSGADGASPSDYVTPQQRVRVAPPTAPLHRDCLLTVATSAAARLAAAADGSTPKAASSGELRAAQQQQQQAGQAETQRAQCAQHVICSPAGVQVAESSPMSVSPADPCARPPCMAAASPGWGPGMIAMLRGLQRTPLAVRRPEGVAAAAAAAAAAELDLQSEVDAFEPPGAAEAVAAAAPACAGGDAPGTAASGAKAACAPEQAFTTPCGLPYSGLQATPVTTQASQLSDSTPLAGGGGLAGFAALRAAGAMPPPTLLFSTPLPAPPLPATAMTAPIPGLALGLGPDASGNKENLELAAAAAAAGAAASAARAAAVLPAAWLQGGSSLTMHLVPVKVQLQPSSAGAPMQAVLSAGAPKTLAAVTISQPAADGRGEACGSAQARSRLQALLEGL